jgi:hypothetical protein
MDTTGREVMFDGPPETDTLKAPTPAPN